MQHITLVNWIYCNSSPISPGEKEEENPHEMPVNEKTNWLWSKQDLYILIHCTKN